MSTVHPRCFAEKNIHIQSASKALIFIVFNTYFVTFASSSLMDLFCAPAPKIVPSPHLRSR